MEQFVPMFESFSRIAQSVQQDSAANMMLLMALFDTGNFEKIYQKTMDEAGDFDDFEMLHAAGYDVCKRLEHFEGDVENPLDGDDQAIVDRNVAMWHDCDVQIAELLSMLGVRVTALRGNA